MDRRRDAKTERGESKVVAGNNLLYNRKRVHIIEPSFCCIEHYALIDSSMPYRLGGFGKFFASLFMIPPDLFFSETF